MYATTEASRVLIVEDLPSDAELCEREVKIVLNVSKFLRVETREEFIDALEHFEPALIISDFKLPHFDGLAALKIALERSPDVPFLILTGSMNEDTAVECIKTGAWDYVIKEHIKRLGPAVLAALEQKHVRDSRKRAETELSLSRDLLDATQRLARIGGWEWDVERQTMTWTDETYRIHGMTPGELAARSSEHIDRSLACYDPSDRPVIEAAFRRCAAEGQPYDLEFPLTRIDGRRIWIRTMAHAVKKGHRIVSVIGNIMDITERKQVEEKIRSALAEKEMLLREVHHRVKNNLQAMIYLIDHRLDQVKDQESILILKNLREQARTIALVYEQLHQSVRISEVHMKEYIPMVATNIMQAFDTGRQIGLKAECEDIFLDIDQAMPCGLMVAELITNSLKYAFPPEYSGSPQINVELSEQENTCDLIVSDNGIGLPENLDPKTTRSMGLRLVSLWATHQMGGTIEVEMNKEGLTYHITFPKKKMN